jgi:hypothetical protein
MLRKQKYTLIVLIAIVATFAGCQTMGSMPFVSQSAGLPAQSE